MSDQPKPYAGGSVPETYERFLVPLLFAAYAEDLASRVEVPAGGAVLETACGTGAVTRHLTRRMSDGATLTVTDLAPVMVDQARGVVGDGEGIAYEPADATDLPFGDDSFDAVVCQFSVMLFPEPAAGMREAARVLKPGGRFHFNVWDRLETNGFSQSVHRAVAEIMPDDPPGFLESPYSYHDLTEIVRTLQQSGFADVEIAVLPRESWAPAARDVATGLVCGSPLANQVTERGRSPDEVAGAVSAALATRYGDGPVAAPMQAFRFTARLQA